MNLPRLFLGAYPTPLQPAPRLADRLGLASLYVKRDDLTGFSLGGNKVRKLEYLLADACARNADSILVCGGPRSNLCQTTAAAAQVLGLDCELILYGTRPVPAPLNLRLAEMTGAVAHFTADPDRSTVDQLARVRVAALKAAGRSPYVIPRGGATAVGAVGYHHAAYELAAQLRAAAIDPAAIVIAVGSGGTLAGLLSGLAAVETPWPVIGASVSRTQTEAISRIRTLAQQCCELMGVPVPSIEPTVVDARGPGYGREWPEATSAGELAFRAESLLLDPVYTAKAFATVVQRAADFGGPVVFWHTGGTATMLEAVVRKDVT